MHSAEFRLSRGNHCVGSDMYSFTLKNPTILPLSRTNTQLGLSLASTGTPLGCLEKQLFFVVFSKPNWTS